MFALLAAGFAGAGQLTTLAATTIALFHFPADMERLPVEVNRLNNQVLVR